MVFFCGLILVLTSRVEILDWNYNKKPCNYSKLLRGRYFSSREGRAESGGSAHRFRIPRWFEFLKWGIKMQEVCLEALRWDNAEPHNGHQRVSLRYRNSVTARVRVTPRRPFSTFLLQTCGSPRRLTSVEESSARFLGLFLGLLNFPAAHCFPWPPFESAVAMMTEW